MQIVSLKNFKLLVAIQFPDGSISAQPKYTMKNASSEVIHEIILQNLASAAASEKLGEKEEAAYFRNHASELTVELLRRGWISGK